MSQAYFSNYCEVYDGKKQVNNIFSIISMLQFSF